MRRVLLFIGIVALSLIGVTKPVCAQESVFSASIIRITEIDYQVLESTKPNAPYTPQVPQFALKAKNGDFIMAIGGFINPILGWDIGNDLYSVSNVNFIPSNIPVPAAKGNKSEFFIDPLHSALDFHVVGLPGTKNQIVGYIKMKFHGQHSAVSISNVYLMYRGFTAGRINTLFQDGAAMPTTIDTQGPNGAVSVHSYQLSYTSNSFNGFNFGVSLELPTFDKYNGVYKGKDYPDLDETQFYGSASQPVPDIPVYAQYLWSKYNRVRVSGILRNFRYRDIVNDQTRNVFGWGVQLSGNLQPCKPLVLYYQATYGQGIGNYIQDLNGLELSYVPKDHQPGKMKASPMMGWLFGAGVKLSPNVSMNAMFSQARVWQTSTYFPDYKYGLYAAGNLFYDITAYLKCGVEYVWGKHAEFGGLSATDNRIQSVIRFSL